jgi:hypothetical protein
VLADKLLKAFPVQVIERSLALLSDHKNYTEINAIRSISPSKVLAEAWQYERLRNCLDLLEKGMVPKPIYVECFALPDGSRLYGLSDGNHRTIAARLKGQARIRAYIVGIRRMVPKDGTLTGSQFCRRTPKGSLPCLSSHAQLSDQIVACLRFLGIPEVVPTDAVLL